MKFKRGRLVTTAQIVEDMSTDTNFMMDVNRAISRYINCDWGTTCLEDAKSNNEAVKNGDRILASYSTSKGTIWIITEWDRSVTTILYPSEY